MDRIPLFKVFMAPDAIKRVEETLMSGYTGQGPRVREFEEGLQSFEDLDTVPLATMTGTHALDLAYHLAGIKPGSTVISTPMTCTATNVPLLQRFANIVWADVDPESGLIDADHVEELVNSYGNVRAIVTVDWAGRTCDYVRLREIADELSYGCSVIQDGAHSLGSFKTRGWGHYRMWSFGAIKHLNCGGDGGALAVPGVNRERALLLRWYGLDRTQNTSFRCRQDIVEPGYKYGMNDVAASIGLANLRRMSGLLAQIQENAKYFCDAFLELENGVHCLPFDDGCSYWLFPMLVENREGFIAHLAKRGVDASEVHSRNDKKTAFPDAKKTKGLDEFSRRQVNIPCGWWLTPSDRRRIIQAVKEFACHQPCSL